MHQQAALVFVK